MDIFNWDHADCPESRNVRSWEISYSPVLKYFNRCHSQCPLYRGCLLVGGSVMGGFTVHKKCHM